MIRIDVNLPQKKDEILIDLSFSYGYIKENDSDFGLVHLSEHYLVTILEQKYKPLHIDGVTDDYRMTLSLSFKKSEVKDVNQLIEYILRDINEAADLIDEKVLLNEKDRIEVELENMKSDVFESVVYGVESKIISKPEQLRREKAGQLKNIKEFNVSDIQICIKKITESKTIVFVGFNGNKDNYDKKYKAEEIRDVYKIELNKNERASFVSDNSVLKKTKNFAIAFLIDKRMVDSGIYYINFIVREIYKKFSDSVRHLGVYEVEYLYRANNFSGYVWFFLNSSSSLGDNVDEIFFDSVNEVLNDKDLFKILDSFKEEVIKKTELEWNNFYDRFDWVVYEFLQNGKVKRSDEAIEELKNLNVSELKKITNQIFDPDKKIILK